MLLRKCTRISLILREKFSINFKSVQINLSAVTKKYSTCRPNERKIVAAMETENRDLNPIIKLCCGSIKGCKSKSIYNDIYYSFEGIPYAQPPVGKLRFKSPLPAEPWSNIRDCTEFGIKPLQMNREGIVEGNEDCLYLNVYTKNLNCEANLPVMVWIYGGAFNTGGCVRSKFGPDYFMHEDVVLVTFNYRVSVFGFLSFKDPSLEIPGNAGLKDQILALKWVQQNIEFFGGNTNNITLFGESAGASSVHCLMCSDKAKGLFHKAICMSGCVLNQWAFTHDGSQLPYRLACEVGYEGPNNELQVWDFLQSQKGSDLLKMPQLMKESQAKGHFFAFMPSLEPYNSEDTVINKPLLEMIANSWANDIPLIIGGNSFEGLLAYPLFKENPNKVEHMKKVPELVLPQDLLAQKSQDEIIPLMKEIHNLHFEKTYCSNMDEILNYLHFFTIRGFWHAIHRLVKSRLQRSSSPTYQYLFDFDSPTFNHHRKMFCGTDIKEGVAHADDLAYIFYSSYSWKLEKDSEEYLTLRRMIRMWTQFAKTSNPNCEYNREMAEWKPLLDSNEFHWLRISNDLKFEEMNNDFKTKFLFWNSMYGAKLL